MLFFLVNYNNPVYTLTEINIKRLLDTFLLFFEKGAYVSGLLMTFRHFKCDLIVQILLHSIGSVIKWPNCLIIKYTFIYLGSVLHTLVHHDKSAERTKWTMSYDHALWCRYWISETIHLTSLNSQSWIVLHCSAARDQFAGSEDGWRVWAIFDANTGRMSAWLRHVDVDKDVSLSQLRLTDI